MNASRPIKVRRATLADAAELCRIYNREVEQSTVTLDLVPRTLADQRTFIADRSGGLAIVVAESDESGGTANDEPADDDTDDGPAGGGLIGFGSLSFYRDRPGYRTSVEDSVYVDRAHHGRGVGSAVLGELLNLATNHGFHTVFARVVGPQEASVALHERHGFALVGIEREVARKFGRWHDVALLQRML